MRVKNKEIRQRRHRKEQKIKEAQRLLRQQYGDKPKVAAPAAEKAAPKAKAAPKKPAAKKPAAPKAAAAKTESAE